jgi:hypothetical protein
MISLKGVLAIFAGEETAAECSTVRSSPAALHGPGEPSGMYFNFSKGNFGCMVSDGTNVIASDAYTFLLVEQSMCFAGKK